MRAAGKIVWLSRERLDQAVALAFMAMYGEVGPQVMLAALHHGSVDPYEADVIRHYWRQISGKRDAGS